MAKKSVPDTSKYVAINPRGTSCFPEPIGPVDMTAATQEQLKRIYESGFTDHVYKVIPNDNTGSDTASDTGAGE